jgi:molybdopterin/thiamine biosynthesis adenylyltransferase
MRLPRVKPEHQPHRFDDGTIRIGGEVYGIAGEIADPHGWVWAALDLLDGTREPAKASTELGALFPAMRPVDAASIVAGLIDSGYLEDTAAALPAELSPNERDRYSRNKAFFRRVDLTPREHGWEAQLRLKNARVVLLGLGGTGSHAAWALAAAGVGRIHCVDSDVVELSNLTRQMLYTEDDLGRSKVGTAIRRLRQVNSDIEVTGERRRITNQHALTDLLTDCDVFALSADEPRDLPDGQGIRVWVNRECAAAGVPWAGGGYNGPLATVGVFAPEGPCYECLSAGEEALRRPGTPVDLGGPGVIGPSAGISGQLLAYEVISLITGVPGTPPGYIRGLNLIAPDQLVHVRHPPLDSCHLCHPEHADERRRTA